MEARTIFVAAVSILISASSVAANEGLNCKAVSGSSVVSVTFNSKTFNGRKLNCISGEFISDMTPCAPNGAYSLSSPTGAGQIVGIVSRWQDYTNHMGGISNNFTTDKTIRFSGGFNAPGSGYDELWSFEINRASGAASLSQKGKPAKQYVCAKR